MYLLFAQVEKICYILGVRLPPGFVKIINKASEEATVRVPLFCTSEFFGSGNDDLRAACAFPFVTRSTPASHDQSKKLCYSLLRFQACLMFLSPSIHKAAQA